MGIITNRRRVMGGKPLPYDSVVEYLESTGTQWIDTGVIADTYLLVMAEFQFTEIFTDNAIVSMDSGSADNKSFTLEYTSASYIVFSMDSVSNLYFTRGAVPIDTETWYDVTASAGYMTVNNIRKYGRSIQAFNGDYPLLMFAYGRRGRPIIYGKSRIKKLSFYNNDVLLRDFIPVRVGQVGYMYDRVSGQLFGNAGTGAFIVGPDVNN